jgi:type I restriction enzyme S subunit
MAPSRSRSIGVGQRSESWQKRTDYGTSQKAHEDTSGVAVLRMNNIQDGRLDLSSLKYVPTKTEKLSELMLAPGDLLFNRTNSYELVGKMAVFREAGRFTFASYLIRVRLDAAAAVPEYINLYFGSGVCRRTQVEPHITRQTNQANFNGTKLKEIRVPTPSFDEQHAIVARVEQLMKVCDELEARLTRAEERASQLVEAVVRDLVA